MNLVKDIWTKKDIEEFYEYEKTLKGSEKDCEWEKRIVNTRLECYGRTSLKAKETVKEIAKGNFISFLSALEIKTHFDSLICAYLICKIKNFNEFQKRLDKFVETIDNWASCDTLNFKKYKKEDIFELSEKYLKSDKPFIKRVGINFYFELIKNENYLDSTFKMFDGLKGETEYYVNMCAAWLLCDCFIKHRDMTLTYLKNHNTNSFIVNKAVSKCRDSYRVSKEDKDMLLYFKEK